MLKNSRGVSNIGCLLTLAVIVSGLYVGYKFAVVQWNVESLKEEVTEATRFWANEKIDYPLRVKKDVIARAGRCGFDLGEDNVDVEAEGVAVTISVSWTEPIIFPGGYEYKRDITISRTVTKHGY